MKFNKKILGLSFFIFFLSLFSYYYIYLNINYDYLNYIQRYITKDIADKWENKVKNTIDEKRNIISISILENELNLFEKLFVKKIFQINPKDLGFKGKFYGIKEANNLILISSVKFDVKGKEDIYETGIQYLPKHVYNDYEKMMKQMKKDIGKNFYIESGYRSSGNQAYLFFKYLADTKIGNNFSLKENAKWVAMPGYSEHGSSNNSAIDFIAYGGNINYEKENGEEILSEEYSLNFEKSDEFKWLQKKANKFNFYLSYPKLNKDGVNYEPWHWHWEKKNLP